MCAVGVCVLAVFMGVFVVAGCVCLCWFCCVAVACFLFFVFGCVAFGGCFFFVLLAVAAAFLCVCGALFFERVRCFACPALD